MYFEAHGVDVIGPVMWELFFQGPLPTHNPYPLQLCRMQRNKFYLILGVEIQKACIISLLLYYTCHHVGLSGMGFTEI